MSLLFTVISGVGTRARARVSVDPVSAGASVLARVAGTLVGIGLTLVPLVARLTNTGVRRSGVLKTKSSI